MRGLKLAVFRQQGEVHAGCEKHKMAYLPPKVSASSGSPVALLRDQI